MLGECLRTGGWKVSRLGSAVLPTPSHRAVTPSYLLLSYDKPFVLFFAHADGCVCGKGDGGRLLGWVWLCCVAALDALLRAALLRGCPISAALSIKCWLACPFHCLARATTFRRGEWAGGGGIVVLAV